MSSELYISCTRCWLWWTMRIDWWPRARRYTVLNYLHHWIPMHGRFILIFIFILFRFFSLFFSYTFVKRIFWLSLLFEAPVRFILSVVGADRKREIETQRVVGFILFKLLVFLFIQFDNLSLFSLLGFSAFSMFDLVSTKSEKER